MKKPIPFGQYYLLDRIAVGGMAEVFKAKVFGVEDFEKIVALKRILPNIAEDHEFITMFIDEAKIAVQLNHANIAQIFELGEVQGSYFIAMEYVEGKDLRTIFERARRPNGNKISPIQAAFIIARACEGLDFAHRKRDKNDRPLGIVHRDISPQNILISYDGDVKIIDFGVAKAQNKMVQTQAGILKGKFSYMSPEQVQGLPLDQRSDIFGLGIVFHEILTGQRLFVGESDFQTLEKVRKAEAPHPRSINPEIPEELDRIAMKALSRDVDARYQYASEMQQDLQRFIYTQTPVYERKDLSQYMRQTFGQDLIKERQKMAEYEEFFANLNAAKMNNTPTGAQWGQQSQTNLLVEQSSNSSGVQSPPAAFGAHQSQVASHSSHSGPNPIVQQPAPAYAASVPPPPPPTPAPSSPYAPSQQPLYRESPQLADDVGESTMLDPSAIPSATPSQSFLAATPQAQNSPPMAPPPSFSQNSPSGLWAPPSQGPSGTPSGVRPPAPPPGPPGPSSVVMRPSAPPTIKALDSSQLPATKEISALDDDQYLTGDQLPIDATLDLEELKKIEELNELYDDGETDTVIDLPKIKKEEFPKTNKKKLYIIGVIILLLLATTTGIAAYIIVKKRQADLEAALQEADEEPGKLYLSLSQPAKSLQFYLNGKRLTAPTLSFPSPYQALIKITKEGRYELRIRKKGFQEVIQRFYMGPGSSLSRTFKLIPTIAYLSVETKPKGAIVFVDGQRQAQPTPATYKIQAGKRFIRILMHARKPWQQTIIIKRKQKLSIKAKLTHTRARIEARCKNGGEAIVYLNGRRRGRILPNKPWIKRYLNVKRTYKVKIVPKKYSKIFVKEVSFPLDPYVVLSVDCLPPREKQEGFLNIRSTPPARIIINNKDYGITPKRVKLKLGKHSITVINVKTKKRLTVSYTIKSDQNYPLIFLPSNWR